MRKRWVPVGAGGPDATELNANLVHFGLRVLSTRQTDFRAVLEPAACLSDLAFALLSWSPAWWDSAWLPPVAATARRRFFHGARGTTVS
jgi:hypothetical protein